MAWHFPKPEASRFIDAPLMPGALEAELAPMLSCRSFLGNGNFGDGGNIDVFLV